METIEERLRSSGLRVTLPRLSVLEFLSSTSSHPTAEEVGLAVNRRVPSAARASVYNVLHSLKEAGLVEELVFHDAVARYDARLDPHHHFICRRCGSVADVAWSAVPLETVKALPDGRAVESTALVMRGLCGACPAVPATVSAKR